MILPDLNSQTFVIYAVKHYDRVNCVMSELETDLKRVKYLKRLFRKYKTSKTMKERLVLNHIIILSNVFGPEAVTRILFYKIDPKDYDVLKTFLIFLNLMPVVVRQVNGIDIISSDIPVDMFIAGKLRQI